MKYNFDQMEQALIKYLEEEERKNSSMKSYQRYNNSNNESKAFSGRIYDSTSQSLVQVLDNETESFMSIENFLLSYDN